MKIDPIIAVNDVALSSEWYQSIFGWRSKHGGEEFDVLIAESDEIVLCLHKWGEHDHPTMMNSEVKPGNGIILYFRMDNIDEIRLKLKSIKYSVEREIDLNENSHKREFSFRDPDGYYLTLSDYHDYEG